MDEKQQAEGNEAAGPAAAAIVAALRRVERAIDKLKHALASSGAEELGEKTAAAVSNLLHEGEELLAHGDVLSKTNSELSGAIRRHPLAAVGIAFGVGLLISSLTRK